MKEANIYRMVMPNHICPFGTKSIYLLKRQGFQVADHHLTTREQTESFKAQHDVKTTPQTFIDGQRIGGYDDLRAYFHKRPEIKKGQTSYVPVISLFTVSALMALATQWTAFRNFAPSSLATFFVGFSMCLLAVQKLKDLVSFTNSFLNYDLLALRYVPYSYFYPFAELIAGVGMLSGMFPIEVGALAFLVGAEGVVSVFKAVYIDKRELKCACMGGDTNVPLGFVSLTENLLMTAMGLWMAIVSF